MSTNPTPENFEDEFRELYDEVMADKAVTNLSGWPEPSTDEPDEPWDEEAYRKRLDQNADILHAKLMEALTFE